jgi:hypothetical protein
MLNLRPNIEWLDMESIALNPNKTYTLSEVMDERYTDSNIEPVVLDSSNMLVDGYKRYLLFVRNNEQRIPIIRQRKTSKVNITLPQKNTIDRSLVRAA